MCASRDRKSTRLNSSHVAISYAVFCLKKKKGCPRSACATRHGNAPLRRSPSRAHRQRPDSSTLLALAEVLLLCLPFFFFNDTATTEIYTLSLHDALPI